jgi:hypothetical protein
VNEASFTSGINKDVRRDGVPFVWKVNDRTTGGIPDARYRGPRAELWIEYKFITNKKIPTSVINELSGVQQSQIKTMRRCGDEVWVVYGIKLGNRSYALIVDASDLGADRFPVVEVLEKQKLVDRILERCGAYEHSVH